MFRINYIKSRFKHHFFIIPTYLCLNSSQVHFYHYTMIEITICSIKITLFLIYFVIFLFKSPFFPYDIQHISHLLIYKSGTFQISNSDIAL